MENERKEQPSRFVKVHEVMEICDCSESHAYRIMKQLNDELKKLKKDSAITEDDLSSFEKDVDKKLNDAVGKVDKMVKDKEAEIMSV